MREYYAMVNYVRPHLLGDESEYKKNFQIPIENGQNEDSIPMQVKFMKQRIYVLQKVLQRVLHRVNYDVLQKDLLPKHEFVLKIRLTPVQEELYRKYKLICNNGENVVREANAKSFLNDYHVFNKIYDHPAMLKEIKNVKNDCWYQEILNKESNLADLSGKMQIFLSILRRCEKNGEKLIVFSQFISMIRLIESVLKDEELNRRANSHLYRSQYKTFSKNTDYYRLDGSNSAEQRQDSINKFNDPNNKQGRLFLLSTRACNLGINLISANRCIIFDSSWNPHQDVQAIFRVYRYGQQKEVYIYRFIAYATWEEKVRLCECHLVISQIINFYIFFNLFRSTKIKFRNSAYLIV